MKYKKALKRILPFTLACVSTVILSSGCQKKINNTEEVSTLHREEVLSRGKKVDGLIYLNSDEIKILEIYDQINGVTNFYFVNKISTFSLDDAEAKSVAELRFCNTEIEPYISINNTKYLEYTYESVFKDGVYLWIDGIYTDVSPYYAEHKYIYIKGNNFYHIEINYLIKKDNHELQNDVEAYTRLDDVLYTSDNEVFKIKVFNFNDIFEKGLYSYEELEMLNGNLNKNNSRKLTNN